jgi:hypothetical protein
MKNMPYILSVCALLITPALGAEEKTADLKAEWSKGERSIEFSVTFEMKNPAEKSSKIPFRITASLYETIGKAPARRKRITDGNAELRLLDSDGKLVLQQTVGLSKLCPS